MLFSRARFAVALGTLASLVAASSLAAQPAPIDLGTLGGAWSRAAGINNRQQVVGTSTLSGSTESRAFLWEDGVMHDLGGRFSNAAAINDRGQIVGAAYDPNSNTVQAMLWEDGRATSLATLAGAFDCRAVDINNRGVIVGFCTVPVLDGLYVQALMVRWIDGAIEQLTTVESDTFPIALNDAGVVIGYTFSPPRTDPFEFVWRDGVLSRADQLTGTAFAPFAINKHGALAGYGPGGPTQILQAFVWDGRTTTALAGLPESFATLAYGLNDHGDVVGTSVGGIGRNFPVVWTRKGIVVLGTVPANYITPVAINDRGDVIADAALTADGSVTHALLWLRTTQAR
jgi:probable HAF family extracellular repeat protein